MSPTFLEEVSVRLREERRRLGFKTQEQMAAALGIPARTYWDREKGKVLPDAEFFATFCELGGDAMFVLTGRKTAHHAGEPWTPYTSAERAAAAIQGLRLTEEDADMIVTIARRLSVEE